MEESNPVVDTAEAAAAAEDRVAVAGTAAQLETVAAELRDRLLRRQADFENFRRRVERERAELLEFAGMETLRALLPVVDDFERALKMECADKEYARGMDLIYQRLLETIGKLGLEPLASLGRPFDPNLHHAVEMAQTEEAEDNTVLEEYQRGYTFRGRLLRPAMVKVACRPKDGNE